MKVLILTCNTGGGHNSAARAIAEELSARGIAHYTENALSFMTQPEEDLIVNGYSFTYKYFPEVFDAGYKYAEDKSSYPMYLYFAKDATALKRYIKRGGYDTVISVHAFPSHMMTRLRRKDSLSLKQYFVATDYTCSPGCELALMDRVFVPRGLAREFTLEGMDARTIFEAGIPVRSACYEPLTREAAREALYAEVPVTPRDNVVLVGPTCLKYDELKRLTTAVCADIPNALFVVICGKGNAALKRQISRMGNPRVRALSYTTRMNLWMKAADVLITKPGGLTSTEAVSCNVPLILLDVLGGPETHNRDYFVNRGCASSVTGLPALYNELVRLLEDTGAREAMLANQRAHFGTVAVREIVDEIVRMADGGEGQGGESGEA